MTLMLLHSVAAVSHPNWSCSLVCVFVHFPFAEELGAAFFPGVAETWATHPLAAYTELPAAALHHHPTLIQHPALAQVPVRIHLFLQCALPFSLAI